MNPPLFWNPQFISLNSGHIEVLKIISSIENSEISMPFKTSGNLLKSPGIGTFGGFFSPDRMLDWYEAWNGLIMLKPEITDYEIIFPPEYFFPEIFINQADSCVSIFDAKIVNDTNHHVLLKDFSLNMISKGNRKKLRQFYEASGQVLRGPQADLENVIDVLEISRKNLGLRLSMSRDQIRKAFRDMPSEYEYYAAVIDETVVASAITVSITAEIKYVLYWGDAGDAWKSTSPVVALYMAIVQDARDNGFSILDLGISSVEGMVNDGLKRFKDNLGSVTTTRRTAKFQRPINLA